MPMLQNKPLFFECFDHPEPLADPYYHSEQLIIPLSPEAPDNAVIALWGSVRDRLTAADVALRDEDDAGFSRQISKLD